MSDNSLAKDVQCTVKNRSDGGYTLTITYLKRHWKPITAEGFFPVERKYYVIGIVGSGEDLSYREKNGFYYPLDKIVSEDVAWDLGYAWIDAERKYIYLNLYWISPPDGLTPSGASGRYRLDGKVN